MECVLDFDVKPTVKKNIWENRFIRRHIEIIIVTTAEGNFFPLKITLFCRMNKSNELGWET